MKVGLIWEVVLLNKSKLPRIHFASGLLQVLKFPQKQISDNMLHWWPTWMRVFMPANKVVGGC